MTISPLNLSQSGLKTHRTPRPVPPNPQLSFEGRTPIPQLPLRGCGMGFIVPTLMERKPNKGQREKAENGHLVLEVDEEPVEARRFLAGGETGWVAVLDAFRESQVAHTCFVQQSFG